MTRTLVILHDAYGGYGGIAKFNRDLMDALIASPVAAPIVVIPRTAPVFEEPAPATIDYDLGASRGAIPFVLSILREIFLKPRSEIVICGHIRLIAFAALYRLFRGGKVVLVMHGTEVWEKPPGLFSRLAAPRADRFIAVSAVTRGRFVAWSGVPEDRIDIVPNTIDLARFQPGPRNPDLIARYGLDGRRVMMTMSRLHPGDADKGADELIEMMPGLSEDYPDLVYLLVGEGADRPRLQQKAHTLGIADRVIFTGYVDESEKVDHLRLADLFLLAGAGEGFGIVLLEAMACGVPVIASTLDGSREAVCDGALGLLVDPTDRAALTAAIREGLARPKGTVPDGLDFFSPARFQDRIGAIIARIQPGGRNAASDDAP